MKKMLFSIGLLTNGVIGFVGWCIAAAQTVEAGAKSTVFGCIHGIEEWLILIIFLIMSVIGFILSVKEFNNDKSSGGK